MSLWEVAFRFAMDHPDLFETTATLAPDGLLTAAMPTGAKMTDDEVSLGTPHPNPTRNGATVPLTLPAPADVDLAVYDALGREAVRLHSGHLEAGTHTFEVATRTFPPGIYLVRATVDGVSSVRRFTVLR